MLKGLIRNVQDTDPLLSGDSCKGLCRKWSYALTVESYQDWNGVLFPPPEDECFPPTTHPYLFGTGAVADGDINLIYLY